MDTAPNINQSATADVYREGTLEYYFPEQVEGHRAKGIAHRVRHHSMESEEDQKGCGNDRSVQSVI
jgi:hypothetical protein